MIALLKSSIASANATHSGGRTLDQKYSKNQNSKKFLKSKNLKNNESNNQVQNTTSASTSSATTQLDSAHQSNLVTPSLSSTHIGHTPQSGQGSGCVGAQENVQGVRTVQRRQNIPLNALAAVFVPTGSM